MNTFFRNIIENNLKLKDQNTNQEKQNLNLNSNKQNTNQEKQKLNPALSEQYIFKENESNLFNLMTDNIY